MPTTSADPGLRSLGWDDDWASALAQVEDPSLQPGRVSRVDRGMCTVLTGSDAVRAVTDRDLGAAVGDWVGVAPVPGAERRARIGAVLPRRTVFRRETGARGSRPQIVAANIDTVFVCDALDGRLSLRHLERFLALAWQSGATPVVLITKADAVPPTTEADAVRAVRTAAVGVGVIVVSSTTGAGLADLAPYLVTGHTVALLGLSGAGKSTLVNRLAGVDMLATGATRRDGSGRHTTTHRELVLLPGGGLLVDTPGMRALSVAGAGSGVEEAFRDLETLARRCRFRDCSHSGQRGCALVAALDDGSLDRQRVESWLRLKAEPAPSGIESTRAGIAERKRRKAAKVAGRRDPKP